MATKTHRKNNRHTPPDRFTPIQHGIVTQPQILGLAAIALPRRDSGAVEVDCDAVS